MTAKVWLKRFAGKWVKTTEKPSGRIMKRHLKEVYNKGLIKADRVEPRYHG